MADKTSISIGSDPIDKELLGGLPLGSLTLIEGPSRSGKSVICQHYAFGALLAEFGVAPYCQMLARDPAALQRIKDFLTINVSEFFRDTDQFNVLRTQILPELLKKGTAINIWSAGCSLGAEPYSVAITLNELDSKAQFRILGTDLDQTILTKARAGGPYCAADVKNVSKHLRQKYFTTCEEGYRVLDSVKARIQFRQQNLLKDSFAKGFDLIICRNVVIYFSDEAKRTLNPGFYQSLNDNGVLFIGETESLLDAQALGFTRMSSSFYRRTGAQHTDKGTSVKRVATNWPAVAPRVKVG